jgi:O-antigen biosynthesis protein
LSEQNRNPDVSIVIVNTNTKDWLDGCLTSLKAADNFDMLQVIVVENASEDGSRALLDDQYPWAEVAQLDSRIGFGPANNIGARQARSDILLFLNQDTVVEKDSLRVFIEALHEKPRWGAAGGTVYDGDGELECSTGSYPTMTSLVLNRLLMTLSILRIPFGFHGFQHWKGYDQERHVGWVTGAYLWIRRDVFEQLGGFDENIFLYCEDVDLCYRTVALGWECLYLPVGPITHFRNKAPVPRARKMMQREYLAYFGRKHYRSARFWVTRALLWFLARNVKNEQSN